MARPIVDCSGALNGGSVRRAAGIATPSGTARCEAAPALLGCIEVGNDAVGCVGLGGQLLAVTGTAGEACSAATKRRREPADRRNLPKADPKLAAAVAHVARRTHAAAWSRPD